MSDPLDKFLRALEAEREERRRALRAQEEALATERKARQEAFEAEREERRRGIDEMLAAEQQAREKAFEAEREERRRGIDEMLAAERKARQEADERLEEWTKRVLGDFGDREGPMWESIASPYVMAHLEATDRLTWVEPLENKYIPEVDKEFDLFGKAQKNGKTFLVVGEVKRTLDSKDVRDFEERLERLQRLRPRRLIKVLFAGKTSPTAKDLARGKHIRLFVHRLDGRSRHAR